MIDIQLNRRAHSTTVKARWPGDHGRTTESGFTVLETAIASVLMAIVGLGIASLFSFAAKNTASAVDRELAMAVAQQQMEKLRNVAFADASLAATSANGTSVNVSSAGRQYVVLTTITDSNFVDDAATVKTIVIQVTPWNGDPASSGSGLFGQVTMVSVRSAQKVGPYRAL